MLRQTTHGPQARLQPYLNLSGKSGVTAYAAGPDYVAVQFRRRASYVYNDASCGKDAVSIMKRLAAAGRGLATFIAQNRPEYASKF